ncbi:MAG: mechanosensitive ion channel [Cruoricaptor ignavus]|nr:mechanosensitive ion channel [Cruoricaptor ignavus]
MSLLSTDLDITFKQILEYEAFSLGRYSLTVYEIIGSILIITLGLLASKIVKRLIYKTNRLDIGKKFAFSQILHYTIVVFIFFLVMKSIGVNISPLLLGSGAILVGVGLGLQNLFLDFVSGIVILLDRTIQVGDVVDIDGTIGEVMQIKMRTTEVKTRENKSIIFPNSVLTKNKLINFSLNDDIVRFDIQIHIHFDADMELVEKIMKEAALEHPKVLKSREPMVWLERFGESYLEVSLYYFSRNLFRAPLIRSDVRKIVLRKFRENNIPIAYPHQTVKLRK